MSSTPVIAIVASDIHLSHKAPAARSNEDSWYDAMRRPLQQLNTYAQHYDVPVVVAGDIFDKWNPPPELINFALEHLPDRLYAIPGQHDLRNHNYEDMHVTGYGTLVAAGKITDLKPNVVIRVNDLNLHGFPWGMKLRPMTKDSMGVGCNLAVVHHYVWTKGKSYPGAAKTDNVGTIVKKLRGYDAIVTGDNHKGFREHPLFNCGGFMRRHSDQHHYQPQVGLLHQDGKITPQNLSVEDDVFEVVAGQDLEARTELMEEMTEFMEQLKNMGAENVSFNKAVRAFAKQRKVSRAVGIFLKEFLADE